MTWLRVFTKCVLLICAVGILLFGLCVVAVLLAQWIPLRPDVLIGLLLLAAIAIATVMELWKFWKQEE